MQCTDGSLAVQGQDLVSGNLTAPAVFALQHPQYGAELEGLIQNEFDGGSSFARALDLVHLGGGIQAARHLARQEADMVSACLLAMLSDPSATTEQPCTMGAWHACESCTGRKVCPLLQSLDGSKDCGALLLALSIPDPGCCACRLWMHCSACRPRQQRSLSR